jgi:hypothetical protein
MKKTIAMLAAAAALTLVAAPSASAGDITCTGTVTAPPVLPDNVLVPVGASCRLLNVTVTGNVKALENSRLYINGTNVRQNVIGDKADVVQLVGNTLVGPVPAGRNTVRENVLITDGDNTPASGSTNVAMCSTTVEEGKVHIEKMGSSGSPTRIVVGGPDPPPPPSSPLTTDVVDTGPPPVSPVHNCGNPPTPQNEIRKGDLFVQENVVSTLGQGANGLGIYSNQVTSPGNGGNLQVFKNRSAPGPPVPKEVQHNNVRGNIQCKENDGPFVGSPNAAGGNREDQCAP